MSRISFMDDPLPSSRGGDIYPKFKLKNGERARLALLEGPFRSFVHQINEPVIVRENGVQKGVKVERKRKDGGTFLVWDEVFVKSFQCFGQEDKLTQSGVDVSNCPACAASTQFDRFKAPQPRYALNAIRYATKGNSSDIQNPFQVSAVVWVFGPQKFDQLRSFAKLGYKLDENDLIVGPCTHEDFQKYEMIVSPNPAVWKDNENTRALTTATFNENRVEDLAKVIAQEIDKDQAQQYIDRARRGWDIVNGIVVNDTEAILASAEVPSSTVNLSDSLAMFSPATAPENPMDFDALLGSLR